MIQDIEYAGRPLAAITSLPNTRNRWIWTALWAPLALPWNTESIDHLIADGWRQTGDSSSLAETQLYTTARLFDHDQERSLCFYRPDRDPRPPAPVVISFSIENFANQDSTEVRVPMLNPFPLPQIGEYAYVGDAENMLPYHILQLPLEARQRWAEIGEKLRAIAAPSLWPAFTKNHALASQEVPYQRAIQSLRNQQQLTFGKAQSALIVEEANLIAAHGHVEKLRETLKKDWRDHWQEIQILVRTLAQDYYHYHCSLHTIEIESSQDLVRGEQAKITDPLNDTESAKETLMQSTLPFTDQIPVTPEEKPATRRKGRRPAQPKTQIVARRKDYVAAKADLLGFEIGKALQSRDGFKDYPESKVARYLHNFGKERGEILIDIGDGREAWSTINDALNTLDDGVSDTYYALMALGIDCNGIQHICEQFLISPDDILEICCKTKSNGSYTPAQRAEVVKALKTLSLCRVQARIPRQAGTSGQRKRGRPRRGEVRANGGDTYIKIEGNLIDLLSFKIGEYSTITGEELWVKQSVSIGPWAKNVPGLSPSTAIMLREILRYSGQNERYQKRIGIYLTHMFRYNAKHGGEFPQGISIAALLEGAGIVLTKDARKHPGNFKESIERALTVLHRDKVIGRYWEIVDATPAGNGIDKEITERAYGWFDLWLVKKMNFSPPNEVKEHYQKLLREAKEVPGSKNVDELKHPE